MKTYLLLDMYNLFHRCKHIGYGDIETKSGMALHIAFNSMRKMWKKYNIDHTVACLEGGSWRRSVYPEYKANRKINEALRTRKEVKDDEYYFEVMDSFVEFLDKRTNTTVLKESGVEADDFIARWIQLHPDDNHIILSSDSDFYQLLSDNVIIHNGIEDWSISTKEVLNEKDEPAYREKNVKDKITKKLKKEKVFIQPPNPEYELFKKCIRGDSSDNIMTAYPKVRDKGTLKKPGIQEAFNDRINKGLEWNMFMLHEWEKVVGDERDENGDIIKVLKEKVRVLDEYNMNRSIIDLTQQPEEIKNKMDNKILEQIQNTPRTNVGIHFLKFLNEHNLTNIANNPADYAKILNSRYK